MLSFCVEIFNVWPQHFEPAFLHFEVYLYVRYLGWTDHCDDILGLDFKHMKKH